MQGLQDTSPNNTIYTNALPSVNKEWIIVGAAAFALAVHISQQKALGEHNLLLHNVIRGF